MPHEIIVNGKFLGAGLNGVHRTAAHYASALLSRATPETPVRLLAPRAVPPDPDFPLLRPEVVPGRFGPGQGWEMLTLPRAARAALLVNFCNLAPLLHSRSVVMIHDAQTYLYPDDYTGRQAMAYRALLPWIARRAVRVLTVSDFSRRSLAQHGVGRADDIHVVHNGTDHILDTPPDGSVLARHGLTPGGFVLTLGSAKGYKNIGTLLAAAPDLSLPLVVAGGPGPDAYAARPPPGVTFTGFVTDGELRALYDDAAAFAFPSLTEGFGLPPVEAMQCGTPVVAADAGAMPEVCGEGAVLVPPTDPAAWVAALNRIAGDADHARALTERGRTRAAILTWDAAGERLWQVIAPLL